MSLNFFYWNNVTNLNNYQKNSIYKYFVDFYIYLSMIPWNKIFPRLQKIYKKSFISYVIVK